MACLGINGGPIKGPPKPVHTILLWWSEGLLRVSEENEVPFIAVIYGLPHRHSNSSKTFKKIRKNWNTFLWRLISQKIKKLRTWNSDTSFITVFNLCYQNLGAISLIVLKLCTFRQRRNFGNFQQFVHHNLWSKLKFSILKNSSERSN